LFAEVSNRSHAGKAVANLNTLNYNYNLSKFSATYRTLTNVTKGGARVEFTYPEGIKFISVKEDGTYLVDPGSCYECTGNCTSGCDVFYAKKKFGCNQCDNGASCTGNSVPCSSSNIDEARSGYVDLNAGISFIKNDANLDNFLKGPSLQILMQIPEVLEAMKKFNKEVYGEEMPDYSKLDGTVKPYFMNLFGSVAVYKIPDSYFSNARIVKSNELYVVDPGKTSCSCTSGTSGCTYDSGLGWEMCESGACVKCRMKVE
jgi:hypothetical protein